MAQQQFSLYTDIENEPTPDFPTWKRRKLRRGTQSCWACKRRKVRCTFPTMGASSCDECKNRGTNCIAQDQPEGPASGSREDVDVRLGRVEGVVDQLRQQLSRISDSINTFPLGSTESPARVFSSGNHERQPLHHAKVTGLAGLAAPVHSLETMATVRIATHLNMLMMHILT